MSTSRLMTVRELSGALHIHPKTVYRLAAKEIFGIALRAVEYREVEERAILLEKLAERKR